jgi:hypothetical protein
VTTFDTMSELPSLVIETGRGGSRTP